MKANTHRIFPLATFALTLSYAVVRYHVFKGVPWTELPLFVLNKSVAWSAVVLMAAGAWQARRTRCELGSAPPFRQGLTLALGHVLASLVLLGPAQYPALYDSEGRIGLLGGSALLTGVIAVLAVAGGRSPDRTGVTGRLVLPLALMAHTALLGGSNWIRPAQWPGHLVPITMWSCLFALGMLVLLVPAQNPHD